MASDRTIDTKWILVITLGVVTQMAIGLVHLNKAGAQITALRTPSDADPCRSLTRRAAELPVELRFLLKFWRWGTMSAGSGVALDLRAGRTVVDGQMHPAAPHHLPFFVPGPDGSDTLMVVMGIFLVVTVLYVGTLYWKLHSLPERMAHKSQKLQFEIVAVLGLISLFTHMHIFWIAGLLLAMIDLPDFSTPLRTIAGSVERIADATPPRPAPVLEPDARPDATEGQGHA